MEPLDHPHPSDRLRRNCHGDQGQGSWTQQWRQTQLGGPQEGKARVEGTGGGKPGWGGRQEACNSKWRQRESLQLSVVPSTKSKHTQGWQGLRRSWDGRREEQGKGRLNTVYWVGGLLNSSINFLDDAGSKVSQGGGGLGGEGAWQHQFPLNTHTKGNRQQMTRTFMQDPIWNFSTQSFYWPQKCMYRWLKVLWVCILSDF